MAAPATADPAFDKFLASMWPAAEAIGIKRAVFDRELQGFEPDLMLPDLDLPGRDKTGNKGQAEFTKAAQAYLDKAHLVRLAAQGREFLARYGDVLDRIEKSSGVSRYVVVAIWGRETAFGHHKAEKDAIRSIATQAYVGRRKEMFRNELVYALKMIQDGTPRSRMKGSWAGAVGLTQFMPSEFYKHSADGDGDGKVDLFHSVPDALASAAQQLKGKGWIAGQTWGYEIIVPRASECAHEGPPGHRSIGEWAGIGFERPAGRKFSDGEIKIDAYLMQPAGVYGPAFLATENFQVIRRYNTSDLYALFVGNLADRIAGGGDFVQAWKEAPHPPTKQIYEIQERLKALGYPMDKVDGRIGSNTRRQIGIYQTKNNIRVDCWPTDAMLAHVRASASAR